MIEMKHGTPNYPPPFPCFRCTKTMQDEAIVVVGAGIIGLSTAVRLKQVIPSLRVLVVADSFTPNTTSNLAGAILRLFRSPITTLRPNVSSIHP